MPTKKPPRKYDAAGRAQTRVSPCATLTPARGNPPRKEGGYLLSRFAGSTIGAGGLNFSVRDGKRWDTAAIATMMSCPGTRRAIPAGAASPRHRTGKTQGNGRRRARNARNPRKKEPRTAAKAFGPLVVLGFDVAVFTPAPYPRHRL